MRGRVITSREAAERTGVVTVLDWHHCPRTGALLPLMCLERADHHYPGRVSPVAEALKKLGELLDRRPVTR